MIANIITIVIIVAIITSVIINIVAIIIMNTSPAGSPWTLTPPATCLRKDQEKALSGWNGGDQQKDQEKAWWIGGDQQKD